MDIYREGTLTQIPKSVVKKKSSKGIKCYKCEGYGHIASNCGNRKSKMKAFNLKRSEFEKLDTSKEKYIAFIATFGSVTPQVSSNDETDHDDNESETEHDWQAEYQTLFAKTMKMLKINEKVANKWKESEEKNSSLKAKLPEALAKIQKLEDENNILADKLTAESQKCDKLDSDMKTLKAENYDMNGRLKMVLSELNTAKVSLNRMNTGSKKLDDILCSQKALTDKHGIGYADGASTSNTKGKNYFAKNSVVTNPVVSVAKQAPKKQNMSRPEQIPTCHHCGIKGHIQPHCNKLRSLSNQKQWTTQEAKLKKKNTKVVWVKKEDLSSVLVHTLLKYLNLQVCVPTLHHP